MENTQSVQQPLSPAEAPIPESQKRIPERTGSKNPLLHLHIHYPWLLPTGLLVIFLGTSSLALYSLSYAGRMEPEEAEIAEAEVVEPIKTPSGTTNSTPLWIVAAIALSCASGSLILFLLLNRPAQRQKVKNHINRYQAHFAKHRPRIKPPSSQNLPVFESSQARTPVVVMPDKTEPVVTVLSPEQSVSMGQDKESLASMLDIRKHTPLSSILRKN
ncbi:hypothetical protein [Mastigocladopsis repens]|uniref:hypothetical protein n=1 Tax=Mastigocladopsis repens TaxID=221287 RepID=UPI00035E4CE3|nr:hypothetical protein [Mastigocladopsis repens]